MKALRTIAIASALALASFSLTGVANAAKGGSAPTKDFDNSVITSDVSVEVSDGFTPMSAGGTFVELSVAVGSGTIVMADIVLPDGTWWDEGNDPYISQGDNTTCSGTAVFSISPLDGRTLTAKGFSCTSATALNFILRIENPKILSTISTTGDYQLTSQFRTADNRKGKATAWTTYSSGLNDLNVWENSCIFAMTSMVC